jgi:hypothetical protein
MTMRIWRTMPLLLILAIVSACGNAPTTDEKKDETAATPDKAGEKKDTAQPKAAEVKPADTKPAAPAMTKIPAGTPLSVTLSTSLNSGKNNAGDTFSANLSDDVVVNGKTVLKKGTPIEGKVVSAEGAGKVKGTGKMSLTLTGATVNGKTVALATKTNSAEAGTSKGRDAAVIGGGAGVGAAIGAIAGGKKGAAIGAAVGGGGGTAAVLATKGKEVEYPAESKLEFTLESDATVPAS